MGLFTKSINEHNAIHFFTEFYESITLTGEQSAHKEQLNTLKQSLSVFDKTEQHDFNESLDAANLQLMDIAWIKHASSKRVSLAAIADFRVQCLMALQQKFDLDRLDGLQQVFNQAFGQSIPDGNTAMAIVFMENVIPDYAKQFQHNYYDLEQATLLVSQQFAQTYELDSNYIRQASLVN